MSEKGALTLDLPPGWRPLRGWILLVAAVAALNTVTYLALTRPRWYDVTAQSRAVAAAREARQLLEPALTQARANYGLVLKAESDLQELHSRIAASTASVSGVIESLQRRLQAAGMQFDRGTYAQERIDELDLVLLQMAVPLAGRYSAVRELVEALAAGDDFMAIDQVGLVNPDQATSGGSLQIELQLAAFLPVSGTQATRQTPEEDLRAGSEASPSLEEAGAEGPSNVGEQVDAADEGDTSEEAPRAESSPTRVSADVSPVQRASELQSQLSSLPPLPFPPEAYDVRLDDLDVLPEVSGVQGRNLFDYVRPPTPPAPTLTRPAGEGGGGGGGGRGRGSQPSVTTQAQPSIPLRLLGIVRVGAVRYASLTDGTEMHVATEGTTLPGGYQIVEIGFDFAEVKLGEAQVRLTLES
jgi:hypothetical protein